MYCIKYDVVELIKCSNVSDPISSVVFLLLRCLIDITFSFIRSHDIWLMNNILNPYIHTETHFIASLSRLFVLYSIDIFSLFFFSVNLLVCSYTWLKWNHTIPEMTLFKVIAIKRKRKSEHNLLCCAMQIFRQIIHTL